MNKRFQIPLLVYLSALIACSINYPSSPQTFESLPNNVTNLDEIGGTYIREKTITVGENPHGGGSCSGQYGVIKISKDGVLKTYSQASCSLTDSARFVRDTSTGILSLNRPYLLNKTNGVVTIEEWWGFECKSQSRLKIVSDSSCGV
jgi:hypothetical protein